MAPKKFTYTPGTGGGKRTKELAKKGAASKSKTPAWTPPKQPTITTRKESADVVLGGRFRGVKPKANAKSNEDILSSITRAGGQAAEFVFPEKTAGKIVKRQKFGAEDYLALASAVPVPGAKALGVVGKVAGKGGKAAISGVRGAEAVASTAKAGTKAFGKTKGVSTIKKASTAGRQSVIAKRTESDAATIKRGTQKSKTQEMAQKLEQQSAKENASKSVFESPESTVRPLAPAPAGAKMPTGMTKAEIKKFGESRSKFLGSGGKQGRTASQRAQVGRDIEETIKAQLAARGAGARAGAEIPGELGARRVGGPAADAATAAPAKAKPAPKPGPKQALRENAQLTAEPTGKPKVPSARASQAVKDKYAKDLAAYEKKQATFDKQQAAIKQKTTDIEMGKAKGPSARETGKPMVKTGPAKEVKKPRATKPKAPAVPAVPAAPAAAKPASRPASMKAPTKAEAKSTKFGGNMKAPAKAPAAAAKAPGLIKRLAAKKPGFMKSKTFKAASATAATAGGALGVGGAIVGPPPGAKSNKANAAKGTYQAGKNDGRLSRLTVRKAQADRATTAAETPKKKFGTAGESKFIKGRSAVRQSTIDQIKKQGMTKSLAAVKSRQNDPEYIEAIRRFYGAKRLKQALKG